MAAAGEVLTQAVSRPHSDAKTSTTDDGLSAFVGVRSRLFAIAYRMLGSAAEAEDIVQDAWLRWQTTDRSVVRDPPAFLAATTTRLCINVAQSARSRHETCVGPWLPEPVDTSADPALGAERGESLRLAVLVLLAKLCPTERAAYVLREAFDYPHRQIADILQMEEANVRQLVSRARKHLVAHTYVPPTSSVFWLPSSPPARREISRPWKAFLLPMLSLPRMAVGSCARHASRFLAVSVSRNSSRLSPNSFGRACHLIGLI